MSCTKCNCKHSTPWFLPLTVTLIGLCGCSTPSPPTSHHAYVPPNKSAQRFISKGLKYSNAGDYAAAIPHYTQAIECDPGNNNVRLYRLNAYRSLKQYDLALLDCDAMIKAAPDSEMPYFNHGLVLQSANRWDEAQQDFERVKRMNPKFIAADVSLAQVLAAKGDYEKAIQHINTAIQAVPPPASGFVLVRGQLHLQRRDYTNALADFDTVIHHDKESWLVRYWRAKALDGANRSAEALADYKEFHHRIANARIRNNPASRVSTILLTTGLVGFLTLIDDPLRPFTHVYDEMDAEAVRRIEELSRSPR